MGTVGNQPIRKKFSFDHDDLFGELKRLRERADAEGFTLDEVLRFYEIRLTVQGHHIAVHDGDYKDEHVAGICEALRSLKPDVD